MKLVYKDHPRDQTKCGPYTGGLYAGSITWNYTTGDL